MQVCNQCGNYSSDDSIFCGHCANRLNNNCPACGFKNLLQQNFCGNCGKQLLTRVSQDPSPEANVMRSTESAAPTLSRPQAPQAAHAQTAVLSPLEMPATTSQMPSSTPGGQPLQAYALVSIELMNWEKLSNSAAPDAAVQAFRQDCQKWLESHIQAVGGEIHANKKNIVFASFKQALNLDMSLETAIQVCLALLAETPQFGKVVLEVRAGLDIEFASARNPLTSTLERIVAQPGQLMVSEAVAQIIRKNYQLESVGPMPVGKRLLTFYRLSKADHATHAPLPVDLPDGASALAASTEAATAPLPPEAAAALSLEQALAQMAAKPLPTEPPEHFTEPFMERPSLEAPEDATATERFEPAPEPSTEHLALEDMGSAATWDEPFAPSVPPAESVSAPSIPPVERPHPSPWDHVTPALKATPGMAAPLVQYEPPVLGLQKSSRPANLTYAQAIEALGTELSSFLSPDHPVAAQKGKVISLYAPEGLGKSNIIHMVRMQVDPQNQQAIWLGAQNYRAYHRYPMPLCYWIEMLQNLLSLVFEGQPTRTVREQIRTFLGYVYENEAPKEILSFLDDFLLVQPPQPLSVESPGNLGRITTFFAEFFRQLAQKRPLILVLEDIQAADSATLDILVDLLNHNLLQAPIYLLITGEPDFHAQGALADALQKVPCKELVISPLSDPEARQFLNDGPLGGTLADFPEQMLEPMIRQSRGLPLYLEEALRLLHLKEILTVDPETNKFVLARDFDPSEAPFPSNVKVLSLQRLDFLSEKSLYLLRLASVLGEKFAVNLLMALAQMEEAEFQQALTTLFNHGFLMPDAVNTGRFRHGLLWETVYENMDAALRVQVHQLVSETLENDFHQDMSVSPLLLAYHAECGGMPNRALNYWNLAGIYAGQAGSLTAMNMTMFRALDLLQETSSAPLYTQELAVRIMETLAGFNLETQPELTIHLLNWVIDCHHHAGTQDAAQFIEPLGFLASAYEKKGDVLMALSTMEQALTYLNAQTQPLEFASLAIRKLEYMVVLGRMQQARQLLEESIDPIAQAQGFERNYPEFYDTYLQAQLLKGQILLAQCDNTALPLLESSAQKAKTRGMEGMEIAFQLARVHGLLRNGQYEQCNRQADQLLNAIEGLEESEWFLAQWGLLAMQYHCELGDWQSASQLMLTVIAKSEVVHDYQTWVMAQAYAGHITAKLNTPKEARHLLEQAVKLSAQHRMASAALLSWRFLAELELSEGNLEIASQLAHNALEVAQKPDIRNQSEILSLSLLCAQILFAQQKPKEAGRLLEPLWPQVVQSRWQPLIAECAFEIGQLYKLLSEEVSAELSRKYLLRSVEFFMKAKSIGLELRHRLLVQRVDTHIPKI